MTALLETRALTAFYGDFQALFGIDITVEEGETVALIGANGAGKSTFLRVLSGLLAPHRKGEEAGDAMTFDAITFDGRAIAGMRPEQIHRLGLALVPEGRRLFASLTVEENLLIGAAGGRRGPWSLQAVYDLFPDLERLRNAMATTLSGGQRQMVALGRGLMSNPRLLMCDEISLGLAPKVVRDIYRAVPRIREGGTSLLVVEQDVGQAMAVADRVYCLMEGRVTLTGRPRDLTREDIAAAYFGAETMQQGAN